MTFDIVSAAETIPGQPENRKVLAYARKYQDEQVLCVANLSRFSQPVELNLSSMAGMTPVEVLGFTEFPTIGKAPYRLTPGPYGFFCFELQGSSVTHLNSSPSGSGCGFTGVRPCSRGYARKKRTRLGEIEMTGFGVSQVRNGASGSSYRADPRFRDSISTIAIRYYRSRYSTRAPAGSDSCCRSITGRVK